MRESEDLICVKRYLPLSKPLKIYLMLHKREEELLVHRADCSETILLEGLQGSCRKWYKRLKIRVIHALGDCFIMPQGSKSNFNTQYTKESMRTLYVTSFYAPW